MKLNLICVGRLSSSYLREGSADYLGRLQRYLPLEVIELKEEKPGKKSDPGRLRQLEGERIIARLPDTGPVIALDERGKQLSSPALAQLIENEMLQGGHNLSFIIGGPYGLSEAVRHRADRLLSLSEMVFPHQLVRLILAEQLFRAMTIIRREPYHHA